MGWALNLNDPQFPHLQNGTSEAPKVGLLELPVKE